MTAADRSKTDPTKIALNATLSANLSILYDEQIVVCLYIQIGRLNLNNRLLRQSTKSALLALALIAGGCASGPARTPGSYVSQSEPVFLISEAQADRILVDTMNVEFGTSPIVRVEHPNKGYQATIKFMFDSHQIVATMVPSRGHRSDGTVQDGYYFNVTHSGTMPLSGITRSKRLRERLSEAATALSPSVPSAI